MNAQDLLQTIQQFITLSPTELAFTADLFKYKQIPKGAFFLAENEVCRQVGFVEKGIFRYYINDDGEEKTYSFGQEGHFVCNYESFIPQAPSRQIIQALEDCQLRVISYADLQRFYEQVQQGDKLGRLVIEQVFIQTLQDQNSFYTDSPESRYQKFRQQHPDLLQRISQYYIASYVGIKPQSLSRIRKRLSQH